jgi:C4-dicarboxylate-specific signal transduction histidine kinase
VAPRLRNEWLSAWALFGRTLSVMSSAQAPLQPASSYGVAIVSVGVAAIVTLALGPALKHTPTLFFCSVILSSWLGGLWPGVLAGLLSAFVIDFYFIPPLYALGIELEEAPDMIAFISSAVFVSWLSAEQKRTKESLRRARDDLDSQVQERTSELLRTNALLRAEMGERKQAEEQLASAQAEVARVARITMVGELTASIAHELNQPLTGVVTNGDACRRWLVRQPPDLMEAREAVESAIRDGTRARDVLVRIRRLLAKRGRFAEGLVVNNVIDEVLTLAQGELRRCRVSLETELVEHLPPVVADRIELQQVLLNLIINAVESMSAVDCRDRILRIKTVAEQQSSVEVLIQDSGTGIEPERLKHIFDAFYTTKPEGIGMGLAISRAIVERHGGQLCAAGNDGSGATFRLTLPVRERCETARSDCLRYR